MIGCCNNQIIIKQVSLSINSEFTKGITADKRFWIYQIDALMVGVFTAVMDETIQIFSGRGPLVSDIWVDLLGIAIGMGIIAVFMVIKAQKNENTMTDKN